MLELLADPLTGATLVLLLLICIWWFVVEWGFGKKPKSKSKPKHLSLKDTYAETKFRSHAFRRSIATAGRLSASGVTASSGVASSEIARSGAASSVKTHNTAASSTGTSKVTGKGTGKGKGKGTGKGTGRSDNADKAIAATGVVTGKQTETSKTAATQPLSHTSENRQQLTKPALKNTAAFTAAHTGAASSQKAEPHEKSNQSADSTNRRDTNNTTKAAQSNLPSNKKALIADRESNAADASSATTTDCITQKDLTGNTGKHQTDSRTQSTPRDVEMHHTGQSKSRHQNRSNENRSVINSSQQNKQTTKQDTTAAKRAYDEGTGDSTTSHTTTQTNNTDQLQATASVPTTTSATTGAAQPTNPNNDLTPAKDATITATANNHAKIIRNHNAGERQSPQTASEEHPHRTNRPAPAPHSTVTGTNDTNVPKANENNCAENHNNGSRATKDLSSKQTDLPKATSGKNFFPGTHGAPDRKAPRYQTAAKAKRPSARTEVSIQIPAESVQPKDTARPTTNRTDSNQQDGQSKPGAQPDPLSTSQAGTDARPATSTATVHSITIGAGTVAPDIGSDDRGKSEKQNAADQTDLASTLEFRLKSKRKASSIEKVIAQQSLTNSTPGNNRKPTTDHPPPTDSQISATARATTPNANHSDDASPSAKTTDKSDNATIASTLKTRQHPVAAEHPPTSAQQIESAAENHNEQSTHLDDPDGSLRAQLACSERRIQTLQSTLNKMQSQLPEVTAPVKRASTHNRPTLLSKVRVLDHPRA